MKLLQDIIDEHFLSSDKKELVSLFKKYGIFEIITKSTGQIKIQLQRALSIDNGAPITAIITTSSNFLVSVNSQVIKISDPKEKRQIQEVIAQIGLRILLSIIKLFPDEAIEIFESVKESLKMTSEMFDYDYSDINNLMKFEEVTELTQLLTGKKYADDIQEIPNKGKVTIIWTKKAPLDFLTNELKKRKWIKTQSEFSKLFGNTDSNLIVHWDMKYKYELAHAKPAAFVCTLLVLVAHDLVHKVDQF